MVEKRDARRHVRATLSRLRAAFKLRGITMLEVSQRLGKADQFVSQVTRPSANPTLETLLMITLAAEIEPFEIFLEEDEAEDIRAGRRFKEAVSTSGEIGDDVALLLRDGWQERVQKGGGVK